jgi:exosortase/archaeosortase family protein
LNPQPPDSYGRRGRREVSFFFWFLGIFLFTYYGTYALIGLTTPGSYYSETLARYFDYVSWYRRFLLEESRFLLKLAGWKVHFPDAYRIRVINGSGVHVGYSCLGIGIISFWTAFVFSNQVRFNYKFKWWVSGLFLFIQGNVCRIVLLVIAANRKWPFLLNLDSHFWFNLIMYGLIFIFIYFFDRFSLSKERPKSKRF